LGQTYRKQKRFPRSLKCLKAAVSLEPRNGSLHGAIAFTHHLNGNLEEAISGYHVALSFDPNNILFSGLLSRVLMEVTDVNYAYPAHVMNPGSGGGAGLKHPYLSVASLEQELGLTQGNTDKYNESDRKHMPSIFSDDDECEEEEEEIGSGAAEPWEQAALTSPTPFMRSSPPASAVNNMSMSDMMDESRNEEDDNDEPEEESYDLDGDDSGEQELSEDMDL
jgi:tetratricopeptide (TPR) repeat protein